MIETTPRERMRCAMAMEIPDRVPVMCQLSIGHQLRATEADSIEYFLDTSTYVDVLLQLRERYAFDGVLLHKPGRDPRLPEGTVSIRRDGDVPCVQFEDGAQILCPIDDDPMYVGATGFTRPEELATLDPDDPLAWAPDSYRDWCRHKGTAAYATPDEIPAWWLAGIEQVRARAGDMYSIHGEVRSPLDHLFAMVGIQNGLVGLLTEPDRARAILNVVTRWSTAWAVAQAHAGCDAIKCSSPYAGAGFISRDQYQEWVLPHEQAIADAVRSEGAFIYTHTCGAIGDRLDLLADSGVHGIEALDPPPLGTVDLADAKRRLRDQLFIKGNVNPVTLRGQSATAARAAIEQTLRIGREGGQYILSSACSIAPATPPEHVALFAQIAGQDATRGMEDPT